MIKLNEKNQEQAMNSIGALFCDVDDFNKAFYPEWEKMQLVNGDKKRRRKGIMIPSEVMTILIYFHQSHYKDFKSYYLCHVHQHLRNEFPQLLSYTRFLGIMSSVLVPLCAYFGQCLGKPTGVDPKIAPIDLLAANFKESVNEVKSPESRASEIESAIKHHITVNLDEDPEYYKSLSLRLRDIIEKNHGKWEQQVELLLEMTDTIETEHKKAAADIGLSETEYAFYNILVAEVSQHQDDEFLDNTTHEAIKVTTQELVSMFDEATEIVDFFNKQDEIKRMKKNIKRAIIDQPFGDTAIVKILQDRFMELAKTKFNK